jgi:uncharacterized protein YbcC (UPF0753/DUF2309 family)
MKYSRESLKKQIKALGKALPTQAPIGDFVHFNPLMHYESLPFDEATRLVYKKTGALCYLSPEEYLTHYQSGRITQQDIETVIANDPNFTPEKVVLKTNLKTFNHKDIVLLSLTQDIKAISYRKLLWKIEEEHVLKDGKESLWHAALDHFELPAPPPHFSDFTDISLVEIWKKINSKIEKSRDDEADIADQHLTTDKIIAKRSNKILHDTFDQVGETITMRSLLKRLTNTDILVDEQPILFRQLAAWLDLGVAGSSSTDETENSHQGFYSFWKDTALKDINAVFEDLLTWKDYIRSLSDDPFETIMTELMRIGIEQDHWGKYLEVLALEIPGWSGMFNWRDNNKHYQDNPRNVEMADYLAVRLVTEHLFCRHIAREHWNIDATLPDLRGYFNHNLNEFFVRHYTYNEQLPEYLQSISDQLLASTSGHIGTEKWHEIAHLMLTWVLINEYVIDTQAYINAWRLFTLAQHLEINSETLALIKPEQIKALHQLLERLDDPNTRGYLWLRAFENNYKQSTFNAVVNNHAKGRWPDRKLRPQAQLIFCMDDREESIRRHLETIAPDIETIGAAGVFGLPNNFKGLDVDKTIKLAQPVVTAVHQFHEVCDETVKAPHRNKHKQRISLLNKIKDYRSHGLRQSVFKTTLAMPLLFPIGFLELLGRSFFPARYQAYTTGLEKTLSSPLTTRIKYNADEVLETPTAAHNQIGLSETEKLDKIVAFLKLTGFTSGYSRLIVLVAHSSKQTNNPHILAYGCGACSGRFGGPNARAFVNSINEPETRQKLSQHHDIKIPEDSWFIASEHDTTNDIIEWFDTDLVPESHQQELAELQQNVTQSAKLSAQERCQRFVSAANNLNENQAYQHVQDRAASPDQPRAELGHQGCALAFISRRAMHQGVSWDRRPFMVSYTPANDPEGKMLEAQLLGNGVVGVGIAMDYYFSAIQNGYLGSGNKATHNLAGNFGVMQGTSSDLKTGLARQMTELHEPMRLLVVVESTLEIVTDIYNRQPIIKNLLDNQWLTIAVKIPNKAELHEFVANKGFIEFT